MYFVTDHLTEFFYFYSIFFYLILGFSRHTVMSFTNKDDLPVPRLLFLSSLIALVTICRIMLKMQ